MPKEREEVKVVVDVKSNAFTHPEADVIDGAPAPYTPAATPSMTPEERAQRKAFFVQQLERGVVHDRLRVENLPDNMHAEWVRKDTAEVERMKQLGFWVDTEYTVNRGTNSDGTKTGQVADVICMICTKENKELLDEVKHERFIAAHAKKGSNTAKEENDYKQLVKNYGDIIPMVESKTREVARDEVAAAMAAMNAQTSGA